MQDSSVARRPLIIKQLRSHILTESNIRDLVELLGEEMDSVARQQHQRLETLEAEQIETRRKMDRLWHVVETSEMEISDILPRLRVHQERQAQLEAAEQEARAVLTERRELLDSAEEIARFAADMSEFLRTSELTETQAFIRSFVKRIVVRPGRSVIHYTIPMPADSPIGRSDSTEVDLYQKVRNMVPNGGPSGTRTQDLRIKSPLLWPTELRAHV